ncbi:MAG: hypothetical protein M1404_04395 [Acidobacteria bacterium]|nr:hypothetical protein [Acidobacteriota bacterium]
MRQVHTLGVLMLFLAATILPATAIGGEITRTNGVSAVAWFSFPDPSDPNCTLLQAYVRADQGTDQGGIPLDSANQGTNPSPTVVFNPGGGGTVRTSVTAVIWKLNTCDNVNLINGYGTGSIANQDFTWKPTSASLKTTLNLVDGVSGNSFPLTIDLVWTATGDPPQRRGTHYHVHMGSVNFIAHEKGESRLADAMGTMSDGATNFAAETSIDGDLERGRTMRVLMEH